MSLHIYKGRLLHYVSLKQAKDAYSDANSKQRLNTYNDLSILETDDNSFLDQSIEIMPVVAGDTIYPEYIEKGALVVDDEQGLIIDYGLSKDMLKRYVSDTQASASIQIHDLGNQLIMPGFIDTHVHYPQIDMMAAYGEQLLDWLNNYTFVTEASFGNPVIAHDTAQFFLNQLLANGTTSAMVFATSHPLSSKAFFIESERLGTRMICGNVLMDQNAPVSLCVAAEQGIVDTQNLIDKWHNKGRQSVAITPRFAITSSPVQLRLAGELYVEHKDKGIYLQTHLAENREEIAAVQQLYPNHNGYLDVYDDMGLLGTHTTLAHGIYLEELEYQRLRETGTQIAHCPTSNLFLGSGLFDLPKTLRYTGVSFATDVGAGTSLSMLTTLNEAYKVQQLQGNRLSAHQGLYHITLGNAQSLHLEDEIGNFARGSKADFVVIDLCATALLKRRVAQTTTLEEALFVLMMLGDDRVIAQTVVNGINRYNRP